MGEDKKQAMVIHPDKNPETEEQFKQLAAVYNILKDDRTRAMYHRVLDEGLPDWRSTRRRVRRWWTSLSISSPPSTTPFPSSSMSFASLPLSFQNMLRVFGKRGG